MVQFVHTICSSSYGYYTEALWPFNSKIRASGCLGALTGKQAKIYKCGVFFHYDCNQIHYQIGFMGQFVHTIRNSLYGYNTEAS